MAIKLHRCTTMWIKGPHPCWKVQSALDDAGIEYELIRHPAFPRGRRHELLQISGQRLLPAIELEDGTIVREESKDLVARIAAGKLEAGASASAPGPTESAG
jgi:glutathione S-transferase-like protein